MPGPTFKFPWARCEKPVKSNQKGLQCDSCDQWFHCACEHVPTETYLALGNCEDSWYCARRSLLPLSGSLFESPSVSHHGAWPSCGSDGDDHDHDLDSRTKGCNEKAQEWLPLQPDLNCLLSAD